MSKLVRFDEDHFGYLVDSDLRPDEARRIMDLFGSYWPDKKLIVVQSDEFIDLTGQYEIVEIPGVAKTLAAAG